MCLVSKGIYSILLSTGMSSVTGLRPTPDPAYPVLAYPVVVYPVVAYPVVTGADT